MHQFSYKFQLQLHSPVSTNYKNLFESKVDYDVIIQAGEESKEIYAHSFILHCQSTYFNTAFSDINWAKKENGKYIFKKPNISQHILEIILR